MRARARRTAGSGRRTISKIVVAAASVVALVATSGAALAPGDAAPGGAAPERAAPRERPTTTVVTLVTGDRVVVTERAGEDLVRVLPAARPGGAPVAFHQVAGEERHLVIPTDVLSLVPDRLDRDLFDVKRLVADGRTGDVPVIVQTRGRDARAARQPDWAALGVDPERTLESIGAVAGDLETTAGPGEPASSWALLRALGAPGGGGRAGGGSVSQRSGAAAQAAPSAGAITKVWLDRRVEPQDADSMPQIGAPQAWDAGHAGEGVSVGVVDTGVDDTHPDLDDGVVAAARDFTGSGDDPESTTDDVGHGTHVASIVAGSGEASDGVNRGVAPGARVLDAKVLTPQGGDTSWVIDGMEWAAEQGADILNLSLGEPGNYTDGTDPASLAVDALSERYGLLAVAAAGNEGPLPGTIPTFGTASSALTVAAVGDDDVVAGFSSVGPRVDGALKPDIAAPGVGIVAARAAGTTLDEPVDDLHVAASGTSMAAPHVAGAAAVVRSARPDLSGQELKDVLMASTQPGGNSVWQEGTGRVWIPGALRQTVTSDPPSLSFGIVPYPQDEAEPVTRTVTYRNPGEAAVELDLELTVRDEAGEPAPDRTVTTSVSRLAVPPGGAASVDLTLDPATAPPGAYGGALVARSADGDQVRTAVGFVNESEKYDLTIRATDVDGSPATSDDHLVLQNAADPWDWTWIEPRFTDGVATVRLAPGSYYLAGFFEARDDGSSWPTAVTAVAEPMIEVAGTTTVELDARDARALDVTTHRATDDSGKKLLFYRLVDGEYNGTVSAEYGGYTDDVAAPDFYALPTERVGEGVEFELVSLTQQRQPVLQVTAHPGAGDVPATAVPGSGPVTGRAWARLVDARGGSAAELADARVRGRFALVDQGDVAAQAAAAEAAGARGLLVRGAGLGTVPGTVDGAGIPVLATDRDTGDRLRDELGSRPVRLRVVGRDQAAYSFDTVVEREGQVPDEDLTLHAGPGNLATLDMEYRAIGAEGQVTATPVIVRDGRQGVYGLDSELTAPVKRTEYVSAAEDVRWYHQVMPRHTGGMLAGAFESEFRAFRPGDTAEEVWLAQAHHGGFTPPGVGGDGQLRPPSAVRDWDTFTFEMPFWVDDAGHSMPIALPWEEEADVRFRLWQDDELLLDSPVTWGSVFDLPEETARYRLRSDVARSTPWWELSTSVTTEWEFTSAFEDDRVVLPLLQIDYGLSLDDRNRGERREVLHLSAAHQDGSTPSAVEDMRLWASADDGETWTPVDVTGGSGSHGDAGFTAVVRVPRGTEHVSLRAEARDAAGSQVSETVIRAYSVRR
ncbi:S8 family serine peptidase [Promicromonospora iranensis]|uniref:S8 family serine peptidase n=1 Tax=Promicromonospora iranensis TaxID=1105144 RepID=UPI0023A94755|nr:S8 family serine peptidase [Promicromonospora iranensis]